MSEHTGGKPTTFYGLILKVTLMTPAVRCHMSQCRACPALDRCTETVDPTFLLEKCQRGEEEKQRKSEGEREEGEKDGAGNT